MFVIAFVWTLCALLNVRMARMLGRSTLAWGLLALPVAPLATLCL